MTTQDNCHVHSVPSVADSRTCLCDTQIVPGWSSRCAQSHVHLIPPQPCRNNQSGKKKGPCRALPTSPVLCPHSPSPMINLAHLKEEGPLVLSSREVSGRDYPTSQTSGLSNSIHRDCTGLCPRHTSIRRMQKLCIRENAIANTLPAKT